MTSTTRAAVPADREALVALLDRAFTSRGFASFGTRYPHLFTDAAIGQHRIALSDGAIVGCVGAYRFDARLHGRPLRVAGIGQVGTAPEAQGRGVMQALLDEALRDPDVDLWWLYGDRRRYARVGFAPGGAVVEGLTWDRYLADVPLAGPPIRALDRATDAQRIVAALAARPFALVLDARQRELLLDGAEVTGLTDGAALILCDHGCRTVWAVEGEPAAVARLVAHRVAALRAADPKDTGVRIHADPGDAAALALVRMLAGGVSERPSASFRIGRLRPLLAAWAASQPPPPGARFRPTTLDGGEAGHVRVSVADGAWTIEDASGPADVSLRGAELAELVMGTVPIAAWNLPRDAALAHLLPLRFAVPGCYGL